MALPQMAHGSCWARQYRRTFLRALPLATRGFLFMRPPALKKKASPKEGLFLAECPKLDSLDDTVMCRTSQYASVLTFGHAQALDAPLESVGIDKV